MDTIRRLEPRATIGSDRIHRLGPAPPRASRRTSSSPSCRTRRNCSRTAMKSVSLNEARRREGGTPSSQRAEKGAPGPRRHSAADLRVTLSAGQSGLGAPMNPKPSAKPRSRRSRRPMTTPTTSTADDILLGEAEHPTDYADLLSPVANSCYSALILQRADGFDFAAAARFRAVSHCRTNSAACPRR